MLKWYGDKCEREIRSEVSRRVDAAGRLLKNRIRQEIGRPQVTRGTGTKKRGLDPSQPGEYPKKVLGHLRRNIEAEHDPATATSRVGTNVLYGKFLELGTRKMKRRPWLSKGIQDSLLQLRAILGRRWRA